MVKKVSSFTIKLYSYSHLTFVRGQKRICFYAEYTEAKIKFDERDREKKHRFQINELPMRVCM